MNSATATLLAELDAEVPATRRVLERLPHDRLEWQPHPKSMTAGQLGLHVASVPANVARMAQADGFDVANAPGSYPSPASHAALLDTFERSVDGLRAVLSRLDDASAESTWRLTFQGREIASWSRLTLIRTMGLNHWYHHRGELVLYLRLLGVAVPVVYGRSADENPFAPAVAAV